MTRTHERAAPAGFSAEWLSLREPFDLAARVAGAASPAWDAHLASFRATVATETIRVLDLACGLGSNLRVLAPRFGGAQHWHMVDHDLSLLAALPAAMEHWSRQQGYRYVEMTGAVCRIDGADFAVTVSCERLDLSRELGSLDLAHTSLITASALLDLVSAAWLHRLIERALGAGAAMLWALSVDGRTAWDAADPDDGTVHALFCLHQDRDKGFGLAMGSQAPALALAQLAHAGYRSTTARTDWRIDGKQGMPVQQAMIDGIAAAALEQDPSMQARVRAWRVRRLAGVERSSLHVGHLDILATLR